MVLSTSESTLYQYQQRTIAETIQKAIDIPLKIVEASSLEEEIEKVVDALRELQVEAFLIGGLLSEYQRTKFNDIGMRAGIPCYAPLWRHDQYSHMEEVISHFKFILSVVAALGFTKEDVGAVVDKEFLKKLKKLNQHYGVSIGGEGGEYESLVLDAPFFKSRILIEESYVEFDEIRQVVYLHKEKLRVEK